MPPLFITAYDNCLRNFVQGDGVNPRVFLPIASAAAGGRLHSLRAKGSNAALLILELFLAEMLTTREGMGTGTLDEGGGGSDTITRTTGSFLTDGWRVGDRLLVQGATTAANDIAIHPLTAVAALTLTFATGTLPGADEALPDGAKLYRLTSQGSIPIPPRPGQDLNPMANLLDPRYLTFLREDESGQFILLGQNTGLAGKLSAALGSGEALEITGEFGNY